MPLPILFTMLLHIHGNFQCQAIIVLVGTETQGESDYYRNYFVAPTADGFGYLVIACHELFATCN